MGTACEDGLTAAKHSFDLLALIRADTGERGAESGGCIRFHKCPVCGHNDDFAYYPDSNSWHCFSASNATGTDGGSAVDYLMAVHGVGKTEAITRVRETTGYELQPGELSDAPLACEAKPDDGFEKTKGGHIKCSMTNFKLAMQSDPALAGRIRYNLLEHQVYAVERLPWTDGDEGELSPWLDVWDVKAREHVNASFGFLCGDKDAQDAILSTAWDNRFDPIRDMLAELPEWDGERHAERLLVDYLGCEDNAYIREVSRLMVYGMVERQATPGAWFDYMPVLTGSQGIGKSTFCRRLALRDEFFTDQVQKLDSADKDELQKLQGKTVAEIGELNALRKADTDPAKAFISARSDDFRMSYGKHVLKHKRRFILIGTTNETEFLADRTGNRRFLPVRCGVAKPAKSIMDDGAKEDFEQAAAEALAFRKRFGKLQLIASKECKAVAKEEQERARLESPYETPIAAFLDTMKPGDKVCAAMVAEQALDVGTGQGNYRQVTRECTRVLDSMHGKVERMAARQRVTGYGSSVTAWKVL